jgi:hypothetical protein
MRLPIRNKSDRTLTIFVEVLCHEYEVPAGGEAIVRLDDGLPHSIDIQEAWVTIWDEGVNATVEVITEEENAIIEALGFVRRWLISLDAQSAADEIDNAVDRLEKRDGYLKSHAKVFRAFHQGFRIKDAEASPINDALPPWSGHKSLSGSYYAGGAAAYLDSIQRTKAAFPGLGVGPSDTDTARTTLDRAAKVADEPGRFETR